MEVKSVKYTNLKNKIHSGKVRDIYNIDDDKLLFVATDRISAFDVIMNEVVPQKGIILNNLSSFWFDFFKDTKSHFISKAEDYDFSDTPYEKIKDKEILKRSTVVKKAERINIECVVRGYITGSAWNEYKSTNSINYKKIEQKLLEAQKFETPIFTPSTKADEGHDEPLSEDDGVNLIGSQLYHELEKISIELYSKAAKYCLGKGIILADTKFEFGYIDNNITLIDEALTPDSSRFWKYTDYELGKSPDPFDKQFLRNWLNEQNWDKTPPPPKLPENVIKSTLKRYLDIYEIITNDNLEL